MTNIDSLTLGSTNDTFVTVDQMQTPSTVDVVNENFVARFYNSNDSSVSVKFVVDISQHSDYTASPDTFDKLADGTITLDDVVVDIYTDVVLA